MGSVALMSCRAKSSLGVGGSDPWEDPSRQGHMNQFLKTTLSSCQLLSSPQCSSVYVIFTE